MKNAGPTSLPVAALVVAGILVVVAFMMCGCVRMREAAYYAPPKPKVCRVPVYVDGRLDHCTDHDALAVEQAMAEDMEHH